LKNTKYVNQTHQCKNGQTIYYFGPHLIEFAPIVLTSFTLSLGFSPHRSITPRVVALAIDGFGFQRALWSAGGMACAGYIRQKRKRVSF
jgi:hypothetical protein